MYASHYCLVKVYSTYCVPDGFLGFFQGALATGSPICTALITTLHHTQASYGTLVLTGVSSLLANSIFTRSESTTKN